MSQEVENIILKTVCESSGRLTPGDLQTQISLNHGFCKKEIRKALDALVEQGDLVYSYMFGCSFIEKSFNGAVRISERVILKPPNVTFQAAPGDIVVEIQKGASFGTGAHPTTRLAVKAIERALGRTGNLILQKKLRALDIGAGSGVLCITAVRLGIDSAIGLDIDPCAISEARENVLLNGLQGQIIISNSPIDELAELFFLIIANLRYPTLKLLCYEIGTRTEENGLIVLSGIKNFEVEDLLKTYSRNFFDLLWKFEEKGWSSLVLKKRAKRTG